MKNLILLLTSITFTFNIFSAFEIEPKINGDDPISIVLTYEYDPYVVKYNSNLQNNNIVRLSYLKLPDGKTYELPDKVNVGVGAGVSARYQSSFYVKDDIRYIITTPIEEDNNLFCSRAEALLIRNEDLEEDEQAQHLPLCIERMNLKA